MQILLLLSTSTLVRYKMESELLTNLLARLTCSATQNTRGGEWFGPQPISSDSFLVGIDKIVINPTHPHATHELYFIQEPVVVDIVFVEHLEIQTYICLLNQPGIVTNLKLHSRF